MNSVSDMKIKIKINASEVKIMRGSGLNLAPVAGILPAYCL